jgi:ATP phosphoribosyltransferase
VLESSARLVIPMTPAPERGTGLEELAGALESVVAARGSRYVMANVPRAALGRIREVLPGLRGPTVVDVLNSGAHVAVHAVVPAPAIRRAIADLRALGGEGILVTRIERLMP